MSKHPRVWKYTTLRDGFTWFSEQDRVCDPAVNSKVEFCTVSESQELASAARAEAFEAGMRHIAGKLARLGTDYSERYANYALLWIDEARASSVEARTAQKKEGG